jgi:hypothetical protein
VVTVERAKNLAAEVPPRGDGTLRDDGTLRGDGTPRMVVVHDPSRYVVVRTLLY